MVLYTILPGYLWAYLAGYKDGIGFGLDSGVVDQGHRRDDTPQVHNHSVLEMGWVDRMVELKQSEVCV